MGASCLVIQRCAACLLGCLLLLHPQLTAGPRFLFPRSPFAEHLVRVARLGHPAIKGFWVEREPAAIQHCCRAPALKLSCLFTLGRLANRPCPCQLLLLRTTTAKAGGPTNYDGQKDLSATGELGEWDAGCAGSSS